MRSHSLPAIRERASRPANLVVPEMGTSRDRALNVAAYLEDFTRTHLPTRDKLLADRDAIVDVVRRMDEGESDRKELLNEIERQSALLKRSMAIIASAIMHGMPITEEVAAVRNEIVRET